MVAPDKLAAVENHGARPEIAAARREGIGFGQRRSTTVLEPFVYVARRVGPEAAPYGFLRLAISQNELDLLEAPFRSTLYQVSLAAGLLVGVLVIVIRQQRRLFRRGRLLRRRLRLQRPFRHPQLLR